MSVGQKLWKVVGGEGSGGILVRDGKDLKSKALPQRLSTEAMIQELELEAGRLKYQLFQGTGPETGWVSVKVSGKDLVIRFQMDQIEGDDKADFNSGEFPRQLRPACEVVAAGLKAVAVLKPFIPAANIKGAKEKAKLRGNGDMYGLPIPVTPEEFESKDFGAAWLTKAFHAAGTLPDTNRVKCIVSATNFPGGGSGPKTLMKLEYEIPDKNLDATLFMKLPAEVGATGSGVASAQQRVKDMMGAYGDIWGAEIQFYRFLTPYVPFSVPKYYFGDLNRESHQAVLVTTAVEWPKKSKKEFCTYQVLPPCEKCEDYVLSNSQEYYFALLKHLGMIAGMHKARKLGSEIDKVTWSAYGPAPGLQEGMFQHFKIFVQEVSPQIWPSKVKSIENLKFLEEFSFMTQKYAAPIQQYFYSNPLYIGFAHQNGNTDNAYFFRDANGNMDCGVFDWGSAGFAAYAQEFLGSFGSCLGEMLAEYDDRLIRAFADAYHATGAPELDLDELILQYRLAMVFNTFQMLPMCIPFNAEKHPQGRGFWKSIEAYNDDAVRNDFSLKFGVSMLYNKMLLLSLRGHDYLNTMNKWVEQTKKR